MAENEVTIHVEAEPPAATETAVEVAAAAATIVAAAETAVAMAEAQTAQVEAETAETISEGKAELKAWLMEQINPLFSSIQALTERTAAMETKTEQLTPILPEPPAPEIIPPTAPEPNENTQKDKEQEQQPPRKSRRFL